MSCKKWIMAFLFTLGLSVSASAADVNIGPWSYSYKDLPIQPVKEEGTMIFSDCPEYVEKPGKLYEGTVKKGEGRVYYYHVNNTGSPQRVLVYAKSNKNQKLTISRTVKSKASSDYMYVGDTLSWREVVDPKTLEQEVLLKKDKYTVIHEFDPAGVVQDDLVSGYVDVKTDQPVKLGVAMIPNDGKDPEKALASYDFLPPDEHENRGTFPETITYDATQTWNLLDGPASVSFLAPDASYAQGYDEVSQVKREDAGNFGIENIVNIPTAGYGDFDLFMNPWGGGFMGTFEVWQGRGPVKIYKTEKWPNGRYFGVNNGLDDVMFLGTWKGGNPLTIRFISPGAANLPIHFLLIPKADE